MEAATGSSPRANRGGRPTKLTKDVRRRILRAIRAGSYLEPACIAAGVSYSAYREWVRKFPKFRKAVERAQAIAEVRLVGLWRGAAAKDWKAAKELLARRHPDRWGPEARATAGREEEQEPLITSEEDFQAAMELLKQERRRQEREHRERREAEARGPTAGMTPSP